MENLYNILTIGDIHGRSTWKQIILGGETEYFHWRQSIENDYESFIKDEYQFHKFDKIIFVGDYCDSFDVDNVTILENLKDIVHFARTYPGLVVLLLGNHDIQYIVSNECCSGYRSEMRHDLNLIFKENEDIFKIAFLDEFENEGSKSIKTLWTHAGVTKGWYETLIRDINSATFRFNEFFIGSENWKIDKLLNMCWDLRIDNLFNVDNDSGGFDLWAGPLWVRPRILNEFNLPGYDQVVGHTPQNRVIKHFNPEITLDSNNDEVDTLVYCDVLSNGDFYKLIRRKNNC